MSWNELGLELAELLLPVLAALVITALGYGVKWLQKQIANIDNEIARKSLNAALNEASLVATDAVRATNQTLVDDLKAKAEDGKLTKEEAALALKAAGDYFLSHITAGTKSILEKALGPVEEWLSGYLEAKLALEKNPPVALEVATLANPTSSAPAS